MVRTHEEWRPQGAARGDRSDQFPDIYTSQFDFSVAYLLIVGGYLALVRPLVLRLDEYRFFVTAYPFVVVMAWYATSRLLLPSKDAQRPSAGA